MFSHNHSNSPESTQTTTAKGFSKKTIIVIIITVLAILLIVNCATAIYVVNKISRPTETASDPTQVTEATVETTIDPNPIPVSNLYRNCYTSTEYILPESNCRYYAPEELVGLSLEALQVAYAEISARHGSIINDLQLNEYFQHLSWYSPGNITSTYNTFEEKNLLYEQLYLRPNTNTRLIEFSPVRL